jgi:DNA invertase Pin-like site-specific DNA recombinase
MTVRRGASRRGSTIDRQQAVIYARVSSKEQEREGYSIPAQLRLLREYGREHGLMAVEEFVDVETAKQSGRTGFSEMVRFLKRRSATCRVILVEKTDQLYRNIKDWVTLDELDLEIHFVKEGTILSPDSRSSEKFMHGIKVLMAKNFIDNLSEEVRKGMLEKAEEGIWPRRAPLGYRNTVSTEGKKVIELDPETADLVRQLFAWYATGHYSLAEVTTMARRAELRYRRSGAVY